MDGKAAQGSGSELGDEHINLLPSVGIRSANWRKQVIGSICYLTRISFRPSNFWQFARNARN